VSPRAWLGSALALPLLCGGCTGDLTQVMVVVDSDLDVPDEVDAVRIDITSPTGEFRRANAQLTGPRSMPLPRSLGIVHRGGPLEPLVVTVTGSVGGTDVIQRRARTGFVESETVVLRMDLLRSCLEVPCPVDQTCTANGCQGIDVDPTTLPPWTGTAGRLDASGMDGGPEDAGDSGDSGCIPEEEVCNEADDDCDGTADEGFDLMADPNHCGSCGNAGAMDPANGSSRGGRAGPSRRASCSPISRAASTTAARSMFSTTTFSFSSQPWRLSPRAEPSPRKSMALNTRFTARNGIQ